MADFELEQLKTLFQNLADRLSNTKGDDATVARLALLDKSLKNIADKIGAHDSKAVIDSRGLAAKFSKEFLDELRRIAPQDVNTNGGTRPPSGAGSGQGMLNIDFEKQTGFLGKLRGFGKTVGEVGSGISKFAGSVAGATDKVRTMDGSFGSMATALGLTGVAAGTFAKIMDENVTAYRSLQASGEASVTTFGQMHEAMRTSITSAGEFADAMNKGSDGVRQLGGLEWAKLNKGFRDATKEMGYYGMSLTQIQAAQSAYLDTLRNTGTLFDLDQSQMVKGIEEIVKSSKDTASILGKSRDEAMRKIADQKLDANFQAFLKAQGYTADQTREIDTMMATLDPETQAMIKQGSQLRGGFKNDEMAQQYALAQGTDMGDFLRETITGIFEGRAGGAGYARDKAGDFQKAGKNASVERGGDLATLNATGFDPAGYINRVNQYAAGLKPQELADKQRAEQEKAFKDPGTVGVLQVEATSKEVAATMNAALNKVFDTTLATYGSQIKDANKSILEWTDSINKSISGISSMTGALGLLGAAGTAGLAIAGFSTALTGVSLLMGKMAGGVLKGGAKLAIEGVKAVGNAAADGSKRTGSIFSSSAKAADAVGDAAKTAGTAAEAAAQAAGKAGAVVGDVAADAAKGATTAEAAWAQAMRTDAVKPPVAAPAPATNVPVEPIKPTGTAGGVAEGAADAAQAAGRGSSALSAAAKAAKFAAKFGTPLNMLLQGAQTYGEITDLNAKHDSGEIDDATFKKEFSKSLAKALGGVGGGILGAELGAGLGAAGGTLVAPGAGTLVGGIGGGIAGSIGGMFAGEKMAEALTDSVFGLINPTGNPQTANANAPATTGANNAPTVMPPSTDAMARAATPVEVPLTARDIKQPFDNLQTALVAQMEQSNKLLEAIRDLIRTGNENVKDGTVGNVQGLADLARALDEIRSGQRIQSIY